MQARREEAGRAAARMELEKHPRMRHVQTLLRSVQQLRKTPTLEELLQEAAPQTPTVRLQLGASMVLPQHLQRS
ncbi:hypothetical protein FQA47_001401 [Oryzias melastigma]|uniref:Uncharacterized protein n=1 Tax=Oryzias melastigma TaxID=30732 RepID=A0A834FRI8_ORYME|nr:hypothetical protein FQA47_001401 [Oryzias melastigma]